MVAPGFRFRALLLVPLVSVVAAACSGEGAAPPAGSAEAAVGPQPARSAAQGYDCTALISEQESDGAVGSAGSSLYLSLRGDQNVEVPGYTECNYRLPQGYVPSIGVFTGRVGRQHRIRLGARFPSGRQGDRRDRRRRAADPDHRRSVLIARVGGRGLRVNAGDMEGRVTLDPGAIVQRVAAIVAGRV